LVALLFNGTNKRKIAGSGTRKAETSAREHQETDGGNEALIKSASYDISLAMRLAIR
jgi:hypothetical protein